uniref:Uncharacterized protein n=1 Tax=Tanacetum cinerariifolium TaxID=118510 RepID=A0A699JBL9_TANCI|nr:hypothetical protein [Tanacetum cinerariifolium]
MLKTQACNKIKSSSQETMMNNPLTRRHFTLGSQTLKLLRRYKYMTSSKDVYFIRRIIVVTRLKIMKKYDYGHSKEIEYMRKRLMRVDELHKFSDGTLNDVRSALYDIVTGIRMEYLPMRKGSNLDKKRAQVMVQDIDKQLYQRRLL